jgi:DNA-binding protein WhiA
VARSPLHAANRRRSSAAAAATRKQVRHALDRLGTEVPRELAEAGRLRLAHPEASIAELAALADPPLTKDAIAGRLRRLLTAAERRARRC